MLMVAHAGPAKRARQKEDRRLRSMTTINMQASD